ncbi:hypothetical protein ACJ2A9_21440 [Anaerobacillus sp. MEB173]|uniref:hypothetical protein n=1 Tax=Anaerobacillus sp. MEB173 TaxID=3383345 RepID=UPI003F9068D7
MEKYLLKVHVYECNDCDAIFAVDQDFEDHSAVQCPICLTDRKLKDVSEGEIRI